MRRVVVTGMGMVTPLGCGVETTWRRLIAGESGARRVETFRRLRPAKPDRLHDPARRRHRWDVQSRPAGWSRRSSARSTIHHLRDVRGAPGARRRRLDAREPMTSRSRTGVLIGSGIGGLGGIAETAMLLQEKGPRRVSPFFIPGAPDQSRLRLCLDRATASKGPTTRWSPPARPARTRSAMRRG